MYNKNDKRRLYWLINLYLENKIDERNFCDEFYYSYDLEIDNNDLTEKEHDAFSSLSAISGRYSEYKEDHMLDANAFTTTQELCDKIKETHNKLKAISPI